MNIVMVNGLLLFMLFMWTSAEMEPDTASTGELHDQNHENENRLNIQARRKACRNLGGKCIKKKRDCPNNRPLKTAPGRPYCSKRRHCCYPAPPTESPILVPGNCENNVIDAFASKHVCPSCTADAGGIAVLEYVNDPTYKFPPKDADDGVLIFGLTLLGHPITYGLKNDYCKCGFLNRVPVWLCDEPKQDQHGVWIYTDCSRAHNPDRGFGDYICFAYANLQDGTMVPNSLDCTTQ